MEQIELNATVKQKVEDIMLDISWQALAKRYFGKSSSWFYHKLHERDVNGTGNPSVFSPDELYQLKGALCDLAERIRKTADKL